MGSCAPPDVATVSLAPSASSSPHTRTTFPFVPRSDKLAILHLGDPIQHNLHVYEQLRAQFDIINPPAEDLERSAFVRHLTERTWGDFAAIMRPFWRSGNTMMPWDEELIKLLPDSMRVMASAGAGYDWVDDRCLAEHGIIYCNGAHASTESVADAAIWHIISVFRHMTASSLAARSCSTTSWIHAHKHVPSISHNPSKHTLGIVGLGNIGFAIAQKAHLAFGMKILYTDISRKSIAQESQLDAIYYPEMTDMLPYCDCVLLATPAGPPLLTASTIPLLPRGARVVNIARGNLIDEDALADALESGHLGAAGLDVHAHEPQVNERLARLHNVELTSHTGGGSVETNIAFELLSMQNCEAVLNGRDPLTAVNMRWLKPKASLPVIEAGDYRGHSGHSGRAGVSGRQQDETGKGVTESGPTVHEATAAVGSVANATIVGSTQTTSVMDRPRLETPDLPLGNNPPPTAPVMEMHRADHANGVT